MTFFNILKRKLTLGNILTVIALFIFAILLKHLYLYIFDYLPVKGGSDKLDISYFTLIILFRVIFSAFLEWLLEDKFSTPLFAHDVNGEVVKYRKNILSMTDKDPKSSTSSPEPEESEVSKKFNKKYPSFRKEVDKEPPFESHIVADKMSDTLKEQEESISKLHKIKKDNDLRFFDADGGLDIDVPANMSEAKENELKKEIGKLDRALNNKFSEYKNLMKRDHRLAESLWSEIYQSIWDANQSNYKKLFDKE